MRTDGVEKKAPVGYIVWRNILSAVVTQFLFLITVGVIAKCISFLSIFTNVGQEETLKILVFMGCSALIIFRLFEVYLVRSDPNLNTTSPLVQEDARAVYISLLALIFSCVSWIGPSTETIKMVILGVIFILIGITQINFKAPEKQMLHEAGDLAALIAFQGLIQILIIFTGLHIIKERL